MKQVSEFLPGMDHAEIAEMQNRTMMNTKERKGI